MNFGFEHFKNLTSKFEYLNENNIIKPIFTKKTSYMFNEKIV